MGTLIAIHSQFIIYIVVGQGLVKALKCLIKRKNIFKFHCYFYANLSFVVKHCCMSLYNRVMALRCNLRIYLTLSRFSGKKPECQTASHSLWKIGAPLEYILEGFWQFYCLSMALSLLKSHSCLNQTIYFLHSGNSSFHRLN